jgi:hypothetical protein
MRGVATTSMECWTHCASYRVSGVARREEDPHGDCDVGAKGAMGARTRPARRIEFFTTRLFPTLQRILRRIVALSSWSGRGFCCEGHR